MSEEVEKQTSNDFNLDTEFESIIPWNGAHDTGYDVRMKLDRNFQRVKDALYKLIEYLDQNVSGLDDKFIHKDRVDQTNFLLQFGEFIDSMIAGKGAGIFPDGRAQFEKVEVRSAMIVKELIFNRWFAQEGNVTYSEAGTIERIELLQDGTYDLYCRMGHTTCISVDVGTMILQPWPKTMYALAR